MVLSKCKRIKFSVPFRSHRFVNRFFYGTFLIFSLFLVSSWQVCALKMNSQTNGLNSPLANSEMSGEWARFHVLPLKSEHNEMTSHCVSTASQIQAEGYSHDRPCFHLHALQNGHKLLLLKIVLGSWGQFSSLGGLEGYPIPLCWLN